MKIKLKEFIKHCDTQDYFVIETGNNRYYLQPGTIEFDRKIKELGNYSVKHVRCNLHESGNLIITI